MYNIDARIIDALDRNGFDPHVTTNGQYIYVTEHNSEDGDVWSQRLRIAIDRDVNARLVRHLNDHGAKW